MKKVNVKENKQINKKKLDFVDKSAFKTMDIDK